MIFFWFVNKFICIIFLDCTCRWYHMVLVFVCLSLLSVIISRSIPVATNGIISFLLGLSSIPLYICTTSSLSIHLSLNLGCFHILGIITSGYHNSERWDVYIYIYFFLICWNIIALQCCISAVQQLWINYTYTYIPSLFYLHPTPPCLGVCPGVGLLEHIVALFLDFWGTSIRSS